MMKHIFKIWEEGGWDGMEIMNVELHADVPTKSRLLKIATRIWNNEHKETKNGLWLEQNMEIKIDPKLFMFWVSRNETFGWKHTYYVKVIPLMED